MHPMFERGHRPAGHRHHHPRGGRPMPPDGMPGRHHGGRGRAPRGDVRTAVLLLLAEEPMHGYQLMQAIADRSGGRWTPSPGAIYPTISQLEDEGLVTVTADAGRKLVTLTDAGREHVQARRDAGADPFAGHQATGPGETCAVWSSSCTAPSGRWPAPARTPSSPPRPRSSPRRGGRSTCSSPTARRPRRPDRHGGGPAGRRGPSEQLVTATRADAPCGATPTAHSAAGASGGRSPSA